MFVIFGYSFMLRSRNQTTNQIPRSYKNGGFDWPFDLVIVTWKKTSFLLLVRMRRCFSALFVNTNLLNWNYAHELCGTFKWLTVTRFILVSYSQLFHI